jgi:hypothetical protein
MNKILILPVTVALITILSFLPQDAHAVTSYNAISSGNWNDPSTWLGGSVPLVINLGDTVTIPATITVTIPSGVTVLNHGIITNDGNIIIDGTLFNEKTGTLTNALGASITNQAGVGILGLGNHGTLTNYGTITNSALFENDPGGNINNAGTITNNSGGLIRNDGCTPTAGCLASSGGTINNRSGGTITTNSGAIIHNYGGFYTGIINNAGTINNPGPAADLDNEGVINDLCGGKVNGPVFENQPNDSCTNSIPEFPFSFSLVIMFIVVAAVYVGVRQKMITNFKHS